jgi:hypothetical protein
MRTTIDLQAVTERVFGVLPPRANLRLDRPRRSDRPLAVAMLVVSATAVLGSIGLWAAGHGGAGLRLFIGAVLGLTVLLRLR